MNKVVVFDDNGIIRRDWTQQLQDVLPEEWETVDITKEQFLEDVLHLRSRRVAARHPEQPFEKRITVFDEVDVVFIDYDLIELNETIDITGEEVAYLARCYAECAYIVSLNQFYVASTFDLTLDPHLDYFADLHIAGEDITSLGLWSDEYEGYRPWHWPHIPTAVARQKARSAELLEAFDQPILAFFQFPTSTPMPDMLSDFLALPQPIETVTFADALQSPIMLRPKDQLFDDPEAKARLLAARIHKWLQHGVLPLLRVVMDAPHLIYRLPSLLTDDVESLDAWNETTKIMGGTAIPMDMDKVRDQKFARANWLDRPVWYWREIQMNREVAEIANPRARRPSRYVFCEDTSHFVSRADAQNFDTGHIDTFSSRFIKKLNDVTYLPARNLFL